MKAADFYALAKQNGLSREEADSAASDYVKESGGFEDMKPESQGTKPGQNPDTTRTEPGQSLAEKVGLGKQDLEQSPTVQLLRGATNKIRETTSLPIMRFLAEHNLPFAGEAKKELPGMEAEINHPDKTGMEKAGGMAADMGMMALPAAKGAELSAKIPYLASKFPAVAKAFGMTLPGVVEHQAQDYGATGEVKPVQGAAEAVAGTALPVVGNKFGPVLEKMGIGAARRGLDVGKKALSGANPVDIAYALKNRLIPFFGGGAKMAETLTPKVSGADEALGNMLEKAGVNLNAPDAMRKTGEALKRLESRSSINALRDGNGLPTSYGKGMNDAADVATNNARTRASMVDEESAPLIVPGKSARELRQLADKNAKYNSVENPTPPAASTFNRAYRNQIEDQLAGKMQQTDLAEPYAATRSELRKLTPLLQAAENSSKQPHRMGLGIDAVLGGEGLIRAASHGSPSAMLPELAAIGARRLAFTPGGGRMLYETGRAAGSKLARKGGKAALLAARSGFSPDLGDQ